jgi:hypothetical protein
MEPELTIEEQIKGRLLSAEADHTLRQGRMEMTPAERKLLTDGAAWERAMHRTFKGICTRRDRRLSLRRSAERLGISA